MNTRINIQIGHGAENHHSKQHSPLAQLSGAEITQVAGGEQELFWIVASPVSPGLTKTAG